MILQSEVSQTKIVAIPYKYAKVIPFSLSLEATGEQGNLYFATHKA